MDTTMVPRSSTRMMPPEELAMQSLTKQIFKSRLFRGYYLGRCFVEQIGDYRDVIALQRSERELEKLLLTSAGQLQMFYQRFVPNMWVGISNGSLGNYKHTPHHGQLETCIWAEMDDLAFGEYWFSIKTLRFRDQEVLLKLKTVRPVEPESQATPRRSISINRSTASNAIKSASESVAAESEVTDQSPQVGLSDFLDVLRQWGEGIKQTTYDFMANDVNKHNIMGTIRFLGLLLFSIGGGAIAALRFLGIFSVRFLFELSRLTHTLTPILFRILEFLNKIVGAFFILLTMIWKDIINRGQPPAPKQPLEGSSRFKSITYERSERRRWQ
ncbi:uncharacterized protein LOC117895985 [Drosophila subobscura]|uniref:uncharacterized protein LOC117895985 n=1 Tax=Drosophila subobscura TaxID=7241 RepID=UPI00155B381D|nr:uncharacterized protein LOC117895985 [Drosophila subobscura]XP_034659860.1 uncharacterized protein LOC117895985 [Drosophila subobscura]XP_034659861.1 uncharacterized protein LOC117895985 [Drosophila subobscura]